MYTHDVCQEEGRARGERQDDLQIVLRGLCEDIIESSKHGLVIYPCRDLNGLQNGKKNFQVQHGVCFTGAERRVLSATLFKLPETALPMKLT